MAFLLKTTFMLEKSLFLDKAAINRRTVCLSTHLGIYQVVLAMVVQASTIIVVNGKLGSFN